ncbi:MAG: DUF3164 family protein [Pseudomonadota bacterium]
MNETANETAMKICSNQDCRHQGKPLPATNEYFYKDSKAADGLTARCIDCQKGRYERKTVELSDYMEDGQGRLVHIDQVKVIDKLRDGLVRNLVARAREVQVLMVCFKRMAMDEIAAFVDQSAREYDVQMGGKKGNITLYSYDMNYKVMVQIAEYLVFDERLQVAKHLIDECFTSWTSDSRSEIKTIINDAFRVNQEGKIDTRRILALRRLDIQDPLWQNAMQAISDSLQVAGSKSYMRIYERVEQSESWRVISLDLAAL